LTTGWHIHPRCQPKGTGGRAWPVAGEGQVPEGAQLSGGAAPGRYRFSSTAVATAVRCNLKKVNRVMQTYIAYYLLR